MTRQLELLNAWFDALRPQFAHLRLSVYPIAARGHDGLFIVVGNAELPGQLRRRSWHIQTRTYAEILPLAWEYARKIITEQMGIACWEGFKERHEQTVFESTAEQAVFIRYRYDAITESSLRATPPSELMPMLQDFSVPPLPPAQIISSIN
ncbi:hypothetical protein [Diaphorobacter aerolatus]|uniref:Uncharacterized protein n=1 Tax=Diaphorobacter aerolatus TaxID=1288495 RepID=A0A7H0GMG7_9BURK|nr:hypothetical protein [Diaphorobacter aerolatus]QNP49483.1 hypothetical protein H9K75_05595 [Diaphorobacter aerolatus]